MKRICKLCGFEITVDQFRSYPPGVGGNVSTEYEYEHSQEAHCKIETVLAGTIKVTKEKSNALSTT